MLPILLALSFIAIGLVVVIAGQPDESVVTRSTMISAPPDKVFPHVNELRKWDEWSPWAKIDPAARSTYDGPAAGIGAAMSWDGNQKVGAGKMTIIESRPNDRIRINLEFIRPFQSNTLAEFNFVPEHTQTAVTWSMCGNSSLFFKLFGLVMDCGDMVGRDFEMGLASLKAVAEK